METIKIKITKLWNPNKKGGAWFSGIPEVGQVIEAEIDAPYNYRWCDESGVSTKIPLDCFVIWPDQTNEQINHPQRGCTMKYELDQIIFYLNQNKLHSAKVVSRKTVENNINEISNKEQKEFYRFFGPSGTFYRTCHGVFKEEDVFESREKLAEYICKE